MAAPLRQVPAVQVQGQDVADRRDRQERARNPGRDRDEDERGAGDNPKQVRKRTPYPADRAGRDQADRRRARAAHDRQRHQHQRPDRFPPNHREMERLISPLARYTLDPCRKR